METPSRRQHQALRWMADHHGRGHSGRNSVASEQTFRAMERRGWVRFVRKHTWETDWEMTDAGCMVLANTCACGASVVAGHEPFCVPCWTEKAINA